jgi:membrane protease YdiL (CAAX protease family)
LNTPPPTGEFFYAASYIQGRKESAMTSKKAPWFMLFSRIILFFSVQLIFAVGFFLAGSSSAWDDSANWWPVTVAIADLICLALLIRLFKAEGRSYWSLFRIERTHILGDLLLLLVMTVLIAPVAYFPNVWLGQLLFGDPNATLDLFVRPMPMWAMFFVIVLFPVLQGLTELPNYFGYVMPRIEAQGVNKWLAVLLPAFMLGLQHIAVPFLFNWDFILWRGLMYIPFAIVTGIFFHWRPRLLPYFVVIHILMNMSFAAMFLNAAY